MAVYDGFFDAEAVGENEDGSTKYDRAYGPDDFTGYFANIIGSGVCIHENPDSFKVRLEEGAAVVSPGYLFIQGYWLKNDGDYTVPLSGSSTLAVLAHLNLGARMIQLEARSMAQSYPDSLVLALVNPAAGTVEDTRYNTDICGVIETAGDLSGKVEDAINFIDNEVKDKLAQAEEDINAQAARLDAKIAEVQAVADRISPPPIGSIKFSASQDVDDEWLKCDGSFVSEAEYPELVAALGKLTPSGDKFQVISDGEIGSNITNMVAYGGKLWVYSFTARTLYGIDPAGAALVSIPISSEEISFNNLVVPSPARPLILSIVPHITGTGARLFLAQVIGDGSLTEDGENLLGLNDKFLIFDAEFTGSEESLSLELAIRSIVIDKVDSGNTTSSRSPSFHSRYIPYVISKIEDGVETYVCMCCSCNDKSSYSGTSSMQGGYLFWTGKDSPAKTYYGAFNYTGYNSNTTYYREEQRFGFSPNNQKEAVAVDANLYNYSGLDYRYAVYSLLSTIFSTERFSSLSSSKNTGFNHGNARTASLPLAIAGTPAVVYDIEKTGFAVARLTEGLFTYCTHKVSLPSAARIFFDPGCYLFDKDIYLIFVGTGLLFFRGFEPEDVGYLDTTSVMGTLTQFGQILSDPAANALYLVGQDTTNRVKVGKMVLNTLFDYANDGAWLPVIASDGVPAYIKAKGAEEDIGPTVPAKLEIINSNSEYVSILFNGEKLIPGTYTRQVSENGKFSVGLRLEKKWWTGSTRNYELNINGSTAVRLTDSNNVSVGTVATESFNTQDYVSGTITLNTRAN